MIITRTPFRISFAGGGADLPSFHEKEPGAVISTSIDKYMYITVKKRFGNTFRVSYSRTELVDRREQIEHPIARTCLEALDVSQGMEIVSIADIPAQTGLGSSSCFTVGLLNALHAFQGRSAPARVLAEQACEIELGRLGEPIGKQDQYIAAYGGMQFIQFQPDGQVFVDPVVCPPERRRELDRRLLLFFTGTYRNARDVLTKQNANTEAKRPALRRLCEIAHHLRDVVTSGAELGAFGRGLHQAWEAKKSLESSIHNPAIDEYYARGLKAGALGGKLLGAGGGGFLLFYCEPDMQEGLRLALGELEEVPFRFEPEGSKVIFVGNESW